MADFVQADRGAAMHRPAGFMVLYSTDHRAPHLLAAEIPTLAEALDFCRERTGVLRYATSYKVSMGCVDVWDTRVNGPVPQEA